MSCLHPLQRNLFTNFWLIVPDELVNPEAETEKTSAKPVDVLDEQEGWQELQQMVVHLVSFCSSQPCFLGKVRYLSWLADAALQDSFSFFLEIVRFLDQVFHVKNSQKHLEQGQELHKWQSQKIYL